MGSRRGHDSGERLAGQGDHQDHPERDDRGQPAASGGVNAATILGPDSQRLAAQNLYSVSVPSVIGETWFNQDSGHLTTDPKLRLALTQALDLPQLQKVITSGRGQRTDDVRGGRARRVRGQLDRPSPAAARPRQGQRSLDQDGWKAGSDGIRSKGGKQLDAHVPLQHDARAPGSAAAELARPRSGSSSG